MLLQEHATLLLYVRHVYELYKQQYHIKESYTGKTTNIVKDISVLHRNIQNISQDVVPQYSKFVRQECKGKENTPPIIFFLKSLSLIHGP